MQGFYFEKQTRLTSHNASSFQPAGVVCSVYALVALFYLSVWCFVSVLVFFLTRMTVVLLS